MNKEVKEEMKKNMDVQAVNTRTDPIDNSRWHVILQSKRHILSVGDVVEEDEYDHFDELSLRWMLIIPVLHTYDDLTMMKACGLINPVANEEFPSNLFLTIETTGLGSIFFEQLCSSYEVTKFLRDDLNVTESSTVVVALPATAKTAWTLLTDIVKDNKRSRTIALKAEFTSIKLGTLSMEPKHNNTWLSINNGLFIGGFGAHESAKLVFSGYNPSLNVVLGGSTTKIGNFLKAIKFVSGITELKELQEEVITSAEADTSGRSTRNRRPHLVMVKRQICGNS
nr:hypothetical protein [Tanacetum cinerariifolium]